MSEHLGAGSEGAVDPSAPALNAATVADPPPAPVVADPAMIIDLNHVDDMPSRRLWRWLRRYERYLRARVALAKSEQPDSGSIGQ